MKLLKKTALIAALTLGVTPFMLGTVSAQDVTKENINELIKEYLMENGDVIMEAVQKHQAEAEVARKEAAEEKIGEYTDYFKTADLPMTGNPEADLVIVEFFDYNCGFCKRALPSVQAVLKEFDNVRFVFKEMPILGPTSRTAAEYALAAKKQDKYFEMHAALMEYKGPKDKENIHKIAQGLGLDTAKLDADAASEDIKLQIEDSMTISRELGITGTPAFIIGDQLVPGFMEPDQMVSTVKGAIEKM